MSEIRKILVIVAVSLLGAHASVLAQDANTKTRVPFSFARAETAAIIDRSGAAAGALLEAKLIGSARLKWVERSQIDKVIAEQNLQALFSAETGAQRAALAKTLKADVLAVVRSGVSADANKSQYLELVVFESQCGLRLATHAVPLTEDAKAVAELEGTFQRALAKISEKIIDVVAVPPFLSHDLDYRFNHLAAAFAKSLEQHLQARKGILLVELDEAQSLVREAALSGETVERPLPLFVTGDYRHDGTDGKRRVRIELKFQRGDKLLGTQAREGLAPDEAAPALLKMSDELASKLLGSVEALNPDRAADIKQLTRRSLAYQQLGNWQESVGLLEAAILLDPQDRALRLGAAHGYSRIVVLQATKGQAALGVKALHAFRREMEHVDAALRPHDRRDPPKLPYRVVSDPAYPSGNVLYSGNPIRDLRRFGLKDPVFKELHDEVLEFERTVLLDLCRLRARAGYGDDVSILIWALRNIPPEKHAATIRGLVQELKDLPFAKERTVAYSKLESHTMIQALQKDATYLTDLDRDPNPALRDAASALRLDMMIAAKERAAWDLEAAKAKEAIAKLRAPVERVTLMVVESMEFDKRLKAIVKNPKNAAEPNVVGKELHSFGHCLALSPGLDLVTGYDVGGLRGVFLMREKGKLVQIWQAPDVNMSFSSLSYDGRYAWICVEHRRNLPRLLVFDTTTNIIGEITAEDGIPTAAPESLPSIGTRQYFVAAPLGPGRALLAGAFGRSWIGIANFDAPKGKKVEIIHEARTRAVAAGADAWKRTDMAFDPYCAFTLESPAGQRRVIVGRESGNYPVELHLLIVDPEAKTVSVLPEPIDRPQLLAGQPLNGGVSFVHNHDGFHLVRLEFPGKIVPTGLSKLPQGTAIVLGDDVFLATFTNWHVGSLSKKEIRPAGPNLTWPDLPNHVTAGLSHHYGVLKAGRLPEAAGQLPSSRSVPYQIKAIAP